MKRLFTDAFIYDTAKRSFFRGSMLIGEGIIAGIYRAGEKLPECDEKISLDGKKIIPGFIDIHTHGRKGFDFNDASAEQMKLMARSYALDGTTSVFPTLASAPFDSLISQSELASSLCNETGGALFRGIHLEGRYLNPSKAGAHAPELLKKPDGEEIEKFIASTTLPVHITAALELDEGSFAEAALKNGATLGLGHTGANYAQAKFYLEKYGVSFTHTYNCMPGIHHRDGGPVLCALKDGGMTELICDGFHICPEIIGFTYGFTGYDRTVLVSDSMAATASPDGEYTIAGSPAIVKDGIARTPAGNLAGSTLTLRKAVENLAAFAGISIEEALVCATANPARTVGIYDICGSLDTGKSADFLVCDINDGRIDIQNVYAAGREICR